jgi:serine/threonine protein kinase
MVRQVKSRPRAIDAFEFEPGTVLADKYRVIEKLGRGWEGEVYLVREKGTGIERSVKLFFPQRNVGNRKVRFYAKKLHKLRSCPILIQYHTQEHVDYEGTVITLLVSDFIEGELLKDFVRRQPGRRLGFFQGLHLLHGLAAGMERIHQMGEYHGDLHDENIIIRRRGLGFEIRLLDLYHWGAPSAANIRQDVLDLVHIFYDILGGRAHYAKHPPEVKQICCGLKKSLIATKFKTAGQLRTHLETMDWESI